MLTRIWQTYKKPCIIIGIVLAVILIPLYLYFMCQTGIWYQDAFLAQQKDGSFKGSGYALYVNPTSDGADITFTANGETRNYSVVNIANAGVEFYQDGTLKRTAQVEQMGPYFILRDENGQVDVAVRISYSNKNANVDDLFPTDYELYGWSREIETTMRGEPMYLLIVVPFGVFLFVDIRYPDLFFDLRYRRYIDGDCEPNESYRFWQMIGRLFCVGVIVVCLVLSLGYAP